MYDHIAGELVAKELTEAVVRAGGVGYRCMIPTSTYEALPPRGEVTVFTHLAVREDALTLYGFATQKERVFFRILISASRIGPASALAIMSGASLEAISRAVAEEDFRALSRLKGIGAKTARRIVAEIRDDIVDFRERYLSDVPAADAAARDAVMALISLGYPRSTAEKAIENIRADNAHAQVEELVRMVLSGASS